MLNRRGFIKGALAGLGIALVAPKLLFAKPKTVMVSDKVLADIGFDPKDIIATSCNSCHSRVNTNDLNDLITATLKAYKPEFERVIMKDYSLLSRINKGR